MTAVNVLTQLIRLHQITCGHMKTDDNEVIENKSQEQNYMRIIFHYLS